MEKVKKIPRIVCQSGVAWEKQFRLQLNSSSCSNSMYDIFGPDDSILEVCQTTHNFIVKSIKKPIEEFNVGMVVGLVVGIGIFAILCISLYTYKHSNHINELKGLDG